MAPPRRTRNIVQDSLNQLRLLVRLERKIRGIIASYAVAISLFMLCIPIAAKEFLSCTSYVDRRIILE